MCLVGVIVGSRGLVCDCFRVAWFGGILCVWSKTCAIGAYLVAFSRKGIPDCSRNDVSIILGYCGKVTS